MKTIESVFDKLEREGRLTPVPEADIQKFRESMKRVNKQSKQYWDRQAELRAEARQRIVFA